MITLIISIIIKINVKIIVTLSQNASGALYKKLCHKSAK